jgi:hypothetical protein
MVFVLFHQLAATRLSWRRACEPRSGRFSALARLSLLAIASSMLPACLIDDPPPLTQAHQTPPRLDQRKALPLLAEVIVAKTNDLLQFEIPVSSEDAGEGLNAFLYLDYRGDQVDSESGGTLPADSVSGGNLPPSTLEDTERAPLSFVWQVRRVPPGCHRLTLRVAHLSNLPNAYSPVLDATDLAEAYWWMNLDVDPALGNTLVDCPLASQGSQGLQP